MALACPAPSITPQHSVRRCAAIELALGCSNTKVGERGPPTKPLSRVASSVADNESMPASMSGVSALTDDDSVPASWRIVSKIAGRPSALTPGFALEG